MQVRFEEPIETTNEPEYEVEQIPPQKFRSYDDVRVQKCVSKIPTKCDNHSHRRYPYGRDEFRQ